MRDKEERMCQMVLGVRQRGKRGMKRGNMDNTIT